MINLIVKLFLYLILMVNFGFGDDIVLKKPLHENIHNKISKTIKILENAIFYYNISCNYNNLNACYKKSIIENMNFFVLPNTKDDNLQNLCNKGHKNSCLTLKNGEYIFQQKGSNNKIIKCSNSDCENNGDMFLSVAINEYAKIYNEINPLCQNGDDGACILKYRFLSEKILGLKDDKFDAKKSLDQICQKGKIPFACVEFARNYVSNSKKQNEIYKKYCDLRDPTACYFLAQKSSGDERLEYMKDSCYYGITYACVIVSDEYAKKNDDNSQYIKFIYDSKSCSPKYYHYCYKAGMFMKYNTQTQDEYRKKMLPDIKEKFQIACNANMKQACDELKDLK